MTLENHVFIIKTTGTDTSIITLETAEGGRYLCFQYHMKKRTELLNELFDCRLGRGKYASLSAEEREQAKATLEDREEAHMLKAEIFAKLCGYILC